VLGGRREVSLLDLSLGRSGACAILVHSLLCLGRGLLRVSLDRLDSVSGMLVGEFLDLLGLLVGHVVALLELGINHLLVLDVDERTEESNDGTDQGQAPKRDKFDEEVGNQGCEESL